MQVIPNRPTVLLFDIDGTLILTGGAGKRALEKAFDRYCGRPDALSHIKFDGMTDPAIVREALTFLGQETTEEATNAILDLYLLYLAEELPGSTGYRLLPGIHAVLDQVKDLDEVAVGLGTGNLRRGAMIKLNHGKLDHHFDFGGFGCDSENRAELIRIGAERGAEKLGRSVKECRVVVIGDTPKDVAAAKANQAICVGVATGSYSVQQLLDAGAEVAFPDLTHVSVMDALLRDAP